jgi:CubicO group peptidase (beta-lactamase class C family)
LRKNALSKKQVEQIDALFGPYDLPHNPGLYLTLIAQGEIILQKGYGRAERDHDVLWSAHTRCRIASLTKQMIALLMVERAQAGDFSLNDAIGALLPELPAHAANVTIDQCLLHISGLASDEPLADLAGSPFAAHASLDYLYKLVCRQPQAEAAPGGFVYNDAGYRLLVRWLERRYKTSCDALLKQHLFEPMGMTSAAMTGDERSLLAFDAHMYSDGANGDIEHWFWGRTSSGDGGISMTMADLVCWYEQVLRNPSRIATLFPEPSPGGGAAFVGRGQFQGRHRGHRWIGHTGMGGCGMFHFPKRDLGVVFFGNHPGLMRQSLPFRVVDALFPIEEREETAPVAAVLAGHTALQQGPVWSLYVSDDGDLLQCTPMAGGMIARHFDQMAYLMRQPDGSFDIEDGTFQIRIAPAPEDKLHVRFGLSAATLFRPALPYSEQIVQPPTGVYYSAHTNSMMEIAQGDGGAMTLSFAGGMSAEMIVGIRPIRPGLWFDDARVSLRWSEDSADTVHLATSTASYLIYNRIR